VKAEENAVETLENAVGNIHPADCTHTLHEGPHLQTRVEEIEHARHHLEQNIKFFVGFFILIFINVVTYSINLGSYNLLAFYILAGLRGGLMLWFLVSLVRPFSLVLATLGFAIGFFAGMVGLTIWCEGNPVLLPGEPLHPQK